MDYLTNYYKNLTEQLQEQIDFLEARLNEALLTGDEARQALLNFPGTRRLPPQVTDDRPIAVQRQTSALGAYNDQIRDFLKNNISVNARGPESETTEEPALVDNPEMDEKMIRPMITKAPEILGSRGGANMGEYTTDDLLQILIAMHNLPSRTARMTSMDRARMLTMQNVLDDARRAGIIGKQEEPIQ